jgi:hypothetical protein
MQPCSSVWSVVDRGYGILAWLACVPGRPLGGREMAGEEFAPLPAANRQPCIGEDLQPLIQAAAGARRRLLLEGALQRGSRPQLGVRAAGPLRQAVPPTACFAGRCPP